MRPQYFGDCPNKYQDYWHLTGDHLGQPAETRWKVVAAKCSDGMGPFQVAPPEVLLHYIMPNYSGSTSTTGARPVTPALACQPTRL